MNERQYVNAIARKLKCSGKKKKEIKKQLLADIAMRMQQGEELQEIMSQIGTVKEFTDGFNENISEKEQKQYTRNKVLKILLSITVILVLLGGLGYWQLPKSYAIEQSKYFDKEQVENAMKTTIDLLDKQDYKALQENAVPEMQSFCNQEEMENVKKLVSEDWGKREAFGTVYMAELVQGNIHYAVGEITVSYENVNVTYHLTYDQDMQLAGLYIR